MLIRWENQTYHQLFHPSLCAIHETPRPRSPMGAATHTKEKHLVCIRHTWKTNLNVYVKVNAQVKQRSEFHLCANMKIVQSGEFYLFHPIQL